MSEYILELKGISKIFPGVKALDNVKMQLRFGEIHALMGENGAGKSTFIKTITGVYEADEGDIIIDGEKVVLRNPKDAQKMGIAAIYQHVTCFPHLSVTENIFMGHESINKKSKKINWNEMHSESTKLLKELNANFSAKTIMGTLSVAEQQMVEIAKAMSSKARIIIMDEPTAALTKSESEDLYRITEKLRDNGVSIIFISHRFEDMYRLASRVTVFRDSKYIGTWNVDEISNEELIESMVGRKISNFFPKIKTEIIDEIFEVKNLNQLGVFADISFKLSKGEILGITGLVGSGRTELFKAIFGITKLDSGEILFEGKRVKIKRPLDAMRLGIGYLPEDRQTQGLILDWDICKNITLSTLNKFSKNGWFKGRNEFTTAKRLAEKVNVKANSIFDLASSLSGGNQQKVVIAKLLASDLKIIILDEPTKGVDIGAKSAIYEIISELASQGYGVIMISSEMTEILGMSDRVLVMRNGRITKELDIKDATQEIILEAALLDKVN